VTATAIRRMARIRADNKIKQFLKRIGEAGKFADNISDLILFHNRVRENAEKRRYL